MTEHLHPDDEATELASAYLDGEVDPAEAARVEGDPDLAARVEALRAVRQELAGAVPGPVDPELREAHLAAALAAFDEAAAEPGEAGVPEASVTSLIDVAARRTGASTRTLRLVAVAAVIALVALAVPLLASLGGGSDDDTAQASFDAASDDARAEADSEGGQAEPRVDSEEGAGVGPPSPAAGSADGATSTTLPSTAFSYRADLGSYASLDELEDAARAALGGEATGEGPALAGRDAQAVQCAGDVSARLAPERAEIDLVAPARLEGRTVAVLVSTTDDRTVLTVLDAGDCSVVATRDL